MALQVACLNCTFHDHNFLNYFPTFRLKNSMAIFWNRCSKYFNNNEKIPVHVAVWDLSDGRYFNNKRQYFYNCNVFLGGWYYHFRKFWLLTCNMTTFCWNVILNKTTFKSIMHSLFNGIHIKIENEHFKNWDEVVLLMNLFS